MQLTVQGLFKSFGQTQALRGVSFTAASGSPLGLLGRNGAGKTTAMRIIMNIFDPDEGSVLLDGQPIAKAGVKLGYLPEERGLYRNVPVGDQLVYFARLRGMSRPAASKAVDEWLERLGMSEYRKRKVETLSKGNQQRIQLALTLMNDPDVVILDEPFSGLDPVNAMQLRQIVSEVAGRDKLVIFSSHQMSAVEDFCDDIVILNKGEVVLNDVLSDLRARSPKNRIRIRPDAPSLAEIAGRFGAVTAAKGGFIVTLGDESDRNALLTAIARSGEDITAFETVEPTLEEIFVSAAGEDSEGGEGR